MLRRLIDDEDSNEWVMETARDAYSHEGRFEVFNQAIQDAVGEGRGGGSVGYIWALVMVEEFPPTDRATIEAYSERLQIVRDAYQPAYHATLRAQGVTPTEADVAPAVGVAVCELMTQLIDRYPKQSLQFVRLNADWLHAQPSWWGMGTFHYAAHATRWQKREALAWMADWPQWAEGGEEAWPLANVTEALRRFGRHDEARRVAAAGHAINPDHLNLLYWVLFDAIEAGDWDEAVRLSFMTPSPSQLRGFDRNLDRMIGTIMRVHLALEHLDAADRKAQLPAVAQAARAEWTALEADLLFFEMLPKRAELRHLWKRCDAILQGKLGWRQWGLFRLFKMKN